ncbi:CHAT domain-containing protein [Lactarius psammicola]|nr:CHAT domain-containing protein [Lactarius psammicola]
MIRLQRHMRSNEREDLDKAILHFTESLLLAPHSWLEYDGQLILTVLFRLAFALIKRSEVSNQPEDAICAAKYLRHLRHQPHSPFSVPRHRVTTTLVHALASQVELEAGNVMQNIEEMAVLCRELLTLNASDSDTTGSITLFTRVVAGSKILPLGPDPPSNQVIDCLRLVRKHKPDLPEAHYALALSLGCRYSMTLVNDDYEEAASVYDEIITSSSAGDSQDGFVAIAQQAVTLLAMLRSVVHKNPEYSEEAIYRARAITGQSSDIDHFAEIAVEQRFRYFGSIEGLEALSGNLLSQPVPVVSYGKPNYHSVLSPAFKKLDLLNELLSGIRDNDITGIDEAIKLGRSVVASAPRDLYASEFFLYFSRILFEAFERTHKIEYLNESIAIRRQFLEHPSEWLRSTTLNQLFLSLVTRFVYFPGQRMQDLDELLKLVSRCANDAYASIPERFRFACVWAYTARGERHSSVSKAYESAMALMQDTMRFAPTLQLQHTTLATSRHTHSMPLDYASYQVDLYQLEEAVETLERGRALLWSEMRHLRTSVDQLLQADPQLAAKFAAINQDLEELTKSIPPSHGLNMDDGGVDDRRAVDPFGRLLLKQRGLLKERDNLISQIQALPGFDSFLTSPSFNTLRSAASSGPVIIINHSRWRSDILILLHNTSPSLIPTPHDFYDRASALKDKLLDSRHKYGLDSNHYDEILASVLAELYNLVGKPVIDRLRQLQVPEQSRIWWCPTSVFCSLPLHAMGPIPSDEGEMRYFLDLYICSYTPTLSALIQSRNRDSGSRPSDQPSLLLVAQPDPSLPTISGEIQVVQALDAKVTSLISEAATTVVVIDSFHHHRFVHFACHGTLEAGKPFEAGFGLHGGERLTLLEIVRSHLPTAEFAFLSACHTAEVTEGSIDDEGLHLAAAVQYCGFRSVVGTMWAMVDEDGRDLAEHFYKALFSTTSRREQGIPYHERSAKALRFAVKKLRRKRRITLERWVNFVHYGA